MCNVYQNLLSQVDALNEHINTSIPPERKDEAFWDRLSHMIGGPVGGMRAVFDRACRHEDSVVINEVEESVSAAFRMLMNSLNMQQINTLQGLFDGKPLTDADREALKEVLDRGWQITETVFQQRPSAKARLEVLEVDYKEVSSQLCDESHSACNSRC